VWFFLHAGLESSGHVQHNQLFFDTLHITPAEDIDVIKQRAQGKRINLRYFDDGKVNQ